MSGSRSPGSAPCDGQTVERTNSHAVTQGAVLGGDARGFIESSMVAATTFPFSRGGAVGQRASAESGADAGSAPNLRLAASRRDGPWGHACTDYFHVALRHRAGPDGLYRRRQRHRWKSQSHADGARSRDGADQSDQRRRRSARHRGRSICRTHQSGVRNRRKQHAIVHRRQGQRIRLLLLGAGPPRSRDGRTHPGVAGSAGRRGDDSS